jgi:hypothetical protein
MSISDVRKRPGRGRPKVGATAVTVRLPPDDLAILDQWIASQPAPLTRPEALRQLMRKAI